MLRSLDGADFMTENPVVFKAETDIVDAIKLLLNEKISGATVVDDDRNIVGVISEMDCMKAILDGVYHGEIKGCVGDFMSTNVETVENTIDIIELATEMIKNSRRRIPVVDETGKFIGQFSSRSILKAVMAFDGAKVQSG